MHIIIRTCLTIAKRLTVITIEVYESTFTVTLSGEREEQCHSSRQLIKVPTVQHTSNCNTRVFACVFDQLVEIKSHSCITLLWFA